MKKLPAAPVSAFLTDYHPAPLSDFPAGQPPDKPLPPLPASAVVLPDIIQFPVPAGFEAVAYPGKNLLPELPQPDPLQKTLPFPLVIPISDNVLILP